MENLNEIILFLLGYLIVHKHVKVLSVLNKFMESVIKLLLYPLIWIISRLIKNHSVQLQLCFTLFLNSHIIVWAYIVLIRLLLVVLINSDVLIIDFTGNLNFLTSYIINKNSNELCLGVELTGIQQELTVTPANPDNTTLFSIVEDSDFWVTKQKYTIYNAYKNYLSYENSRNRVYNRIFNDSFDDSIWAEKSFGNFISNISKNYSRKIYARNALWMSQVHVEVQQEAQASGEVQQEVRVDEKEIGVLINDIFALILDPEFNLIKQDPKSHKLHPKLEEILRALDLLDKKLLQAGTSLKEVNSDLDGFLTDLYALKIRANGIAALAAEQQNLGINTKGSGVGQKDNIIPDQDISCGYDSDLVSEISESEIAATQREIEAVSEFNLDKVKFDEELDQKASVYHIFQDKADFFLSSAYYKRFALILSDNYGHVLFKDIQFLLDGENDIISCYCNVNLQKELSETFPDVDWKDKARWNSIFSQFLQKLDKNFENVPFDDLLCKSNILTSFDLQASFFSKFNIDASDIGAHAHYDDDEDSVLKSK